MKKVIAIAVIAAGATLTGCASVPYQSGMIFTNLSAPVAVDSGNSCSKRGTAASTNVLGLFGMGDAGIESAKKSAGITKVSSVDYNYQNVLGLFGKTTTVVCGD